MLPQVWWKPDLLARLFGAVIICIFTGPVFINIGEFHPAESLTAPWMFYTLAAAALVFAGAALYMILQPWPEETLTSRMIGICLAVFASFAFSAWTQTVGGSRTPQDASAWELVIATLVFQGATLGLVHWFIRQHQTTWSDAFGFKSARRTRTILLGIAVALLALRIGWDLQSLCARVLARLGYEPTEQHLVEVLRLTKSLPSKIYLSFAAIVLAPLAEETLFRGILYTAIRQAGFPRTALWGTSLLFAGIHGNLPSFLPLLLLALALALLYEKTNNLLSSIVAHSCFNAANAVMLYVSD